MPMKLPTGILIIFCCCWQSMQAQCGGRYMDSTFATVDTTANVVYTTTAGGSTTELMDVYQPTGDTACLRHLAIWMHGGAFFQGTKNDSDVSYLSQQFAKRGYVCASINYRLASSIADLYDSAQIFTYVWEAVSDLKAAIRYFYMDAAAGNQWRIDTNVIFMGGSSAGGIAVDFAGTLDSVSQLAAPFQAIANNQGGINGNSGNAGYSTKVIAMASLAGAVNEPAWLSTSMPPTVFCQGTADGTVPYDCDLALRQYTLGLYPTIKFCGSGVMAPLCDSLGVTYSLLPFPGSGHVPWDTNVVMLHQTDSAVAAFYYSINCAQAACPISGIGNIAPGPQVNVFPNPAHSQLNISVTDANQLAEIRLYDCTGREVMQQYHSGKQAVIGTLQLSPGVYTLRLDMKDYSFGPVTRMVVIE